MGSRYLKILSMFILMPWTMLDSPEASRSQCICLLPWLPLTTHFHCDKPALCHCVAPFAWTNSVALQYGELLMLLQINFCSSCLWKYSLRWDSLVNPQPSQTLPLAWECPIASNGGLALLVSQCLGVSIQALLFDLRAWASYLTTLDFLFQIRKRRDSWILL